MERPELQAQLVYLLNQQSRWGRRSLAQAAGWGEIVVRRELERLRARGWVAMDRRGTRLTPAGRERFQMILSKVCAVAELELEQLALDRATVGAHLRGVSLDRTRIWRYRDLAVHAGASGAILICVDAEGRLRFCDSDEPVAERNAHDARLLEGEFPECRAGDLLLLVFAHDPARAHRGLWRVIVELLPHSATSNARETAS